MKYYTIGIEVCLILEYSSSFLCQTHEVTDVFVRSDHLNLGNWFFDMDIGSGLREVFRIRDIEICCLASFVVDELGARTWIISTFISTDEYSVCHLWTRDDDVHIVLTPETLLDDVEMEESEESTTESISKSWRCFVFYDKG